MADAGIIEMLGSIEVIQNRFIFKAKISRYLEGFSRYLENFLVIFRIFFSGQIFRRFNVIFVERPNVGWLLQHPINRLWVVPHFSWDLTRPVMHDSRALPCSSSRPWEISEILAVYYISARRVPLYFRLQLLLLQDNLCQSSKTKFYFTGCTFQVF